MTMLNVNDVTAFLKANFVGEQILPHQSKYKDDCKQQ